MADGSGETTSFKAITYGPYLIFTLACNDSLFDAMLSLTNERSFISEHGIRTIKDVDRFAPVDKKTIPIISGNPSAERYLLTNVHIDGQPLTGLQVTVAPNVNRHPVDLILGPDFLRQYARVCFDPHDSVVTLTRPSSGAGSA